MKLIPLTRGMQAMVDDDDFDRLASMKWHAKVDKNTAYACHGDYTTGALKIIGMHREIMSAPKGMDVDHIDGNGLNNCKSNLRVCTRSENLQNQGAKRGETSEYKGVYWLKANRKWRAKIAIEGRSTCLGLYLDEKQAALAYNIAAQKHFGEFARINSF